MRTNKVHAIANGKGRPLKIVLTTGQAHDSQPVEVRCGGGTLANIVVPDRTDGATGSGISSDNEERSRTSHRPRGVK